MADVDIGMSLRAYDQFFPLFRGDAPVPGVMLRLDHNMPMVTLLPDGVDVAEVSFNKYSVGRARGDESLVGLPAFVLRGFRHRNFFVRADSTLHGLAELRGKRVGTNSWPDSGTMWARAAMRDAGVNVGDVRWVIGTLDDKTPNKPPSPNDARPPPDAEFLTGTENLLAALADGRIDAITTAFAPDAVFRKGGAIRRLVRNFREAERDYHRRTGVYPAFHIVAARKEIVQRHPQAVMGIYGALQRAYEMWTRKVRMFAEASPWAMEEYETMLREFPDDTPPFGMESPAHRKMVATLCREQAEQGLVEKATTPDDLFSGFEKLREAAG